ncbi:hypothetical protein AWC29_23225 [Mycobacterium triplex]|uniref:Uncharacterized protein n=1 Tax=Mycobacterium triplex TaxID=47839 RepID=A0ABX3W1L7_9MYCO|nr:hypothetical protein AWC29_23225 [Mycobacterium triplex]
MQRVTNAIQGRDDLRVEAAMPCAFGFQSATSLSRPAPTSSTCRHASLQATPAVCLLGNVLV